MFRNLASLLAILALPVTAWAGNGNLPEARKLLLRGKYAEAAEQFAPLAKKDPAAAVGLARTLAAEGKDDQAVKTLAAFPDRHADVSAELAAMAFQRGDVDEAKKRADEAIGLDRRQLSARWILAELDRVAGRFDQAESGCRWLIRYYNDHDVQQAESLRWIGLAAAQSARWNRQADQFHFLVNELYPDALKLEPDYWPAHFEAGMLFLEKHNQGDAARELQAALEVNPNAAEVHAALAALAMEAHDITKAEAAVARALEINPRLLDAWLVKADLLWANFQVRETLALLDEKALPLCPIDDETLGRMAACYLLLDGPSKPGDGSRFARLVEKATKRNPRPGEFYFALAAQLEDRNKQSLAESYLQEAIRLMPRQVGPEAHLGLLYMLAGRETEARKVLDRAFESDPFNVRVKNSLEVLEVISGMKTLETGRFVLKYDGQRDRLLARYATRHLEAVLPRLCKQFGYTPPSKTPVEIFNQAAGHDGHQWFSARMIGLPYLGTVAASTGRIIGMALPNEPEAGRELNWARVLKHELVHVITLQQTDFNCPHWYTEGLAVWSEGFPRPQAWNELLLQRAPKGELFNLQTLNPGFTRPKSSGDWQMAYCQAELYVEYMLTTAGGEESLRKMLAAYSEGLSTGDAIRRTFGMSEEQFEQGYTAFLKQQVARLTMLKYPPEEDIDQLLKTHRGRPDDPDAAAAVARAYLDRGADKEALEAAQAALKLRPKHQLATYVLARLRLKEKKMPEAVAMLEACLDNKAPEPNTLGLLASLNLKAEKYDEAIRLYALGEKLDPIHLQWTRGLARAYLASANQPLLAETLARLAKADADDLPVRKKLAQMALDRKDYPAAEDWARQAIEINVIDGDMHRVLAEALAARHNYPQAVEEAETAVELCPNDPQPRLLLKTLQEKP